MGDDTEVQVGRTPERDAQVRDLLERTHDPARLLALPDGVFAVVITLLVLEIHVPELTQGHSLAEALAEVRPSFNALVVTFILTGMYWVGHRDLFALIRRTDAAETRAVSGGQGNASASAGEGVLKPRVCRGRPLSSAAIASRAAWSSWRRSVPRERYWRSRPLVFSLLPRCQGCAGHRTTPGRRCRR
jgi:hypothetical protein